MLPLFNLDSIKMAIHGDQPLAMLNKYGVAVEKEVAGFDYLSRKRRLDRGTFRYGDVQSTVRFTWQIVKKTPQPERTA